ncbi:MAG: DEAD/DEAH box helicase family protein [Treponema sp.]|nr:DEAD/DEAH box helicase family protein [Candidatus Treponema merdequi]
MFDNLNIEKVSSIISFVGKTSSFNGDNTIPDLQIKGVTALCNILHNKQYAYLADEVGMGKTYQAIGVISMLLKENPKAKILVIAPNRNVQNNWISEIKNFQKNNLSDGIEFSVKNFEERQDFIKTFHEENEENIFVTRLTTFSTIGDSIVRYENSNYKYYEEVPVKVLFEGLCRVTETVKTPNSKDKFSSFDAGKICGKFLRKYTPDFDLVVIDEAQNMRNENNATVFINYWLGLKRCKDSKTTSVGNVLNCIPKKDNNNTKFLLLSATPAHRNIDSLRNQLFYFEEKSDVPVADEITHEYLSSFLIRRLRTYNNENKYKVRKIVPNNVSDTLENDSEDGLKQRLFLALIQSKLAKEIAKNNSTYKIGFLETFESYTPSGFLHEDEETGEKNKEFENNGSQEVGEKGEAPDKRILQNISKSFYDTFGEGKYPPHPKFSFMEKEITNVINTNISLQDIETSAPDKAVVFVRRLATVDELEKRLNSMYENRIVSYWGNEFGINNATFKEIRDKFEELYINKTARESVTEDLDDDNEESDEIEGFGIRSDLINWLALKKQHKGRGFYSVSKFKKSLLRNKPNSVLFSENYFKALYKDEDINKFVDDDFVKEINEYIAGDYKRYILEYSGKRRYNSSELLPLCCYLALKRKGEDKTASFIKDFYEIGDSINNKNCEYSKTLVVKTLQQDSIWNHMAEYNVITEDQDLYKREVLKAITEKYLKSSEAVLDFMYCYINEKDSELCDSVMKRLFSKKCSHGIRIRKLFENGTLVYKQLLGGEAIEHESQLRTELKFLDLQQWVMPATGGNKGNEGLIKRFNTPFYPDVIVCTDVLKEGINLHLFCNRIYHYGLAWTPGDLEQRIGRIDRFFSKTHRERTIQENLSEDEKTKIEVNYPYLGKSVDEHQLKQVLKFKLSADPLLDSKSLDQKDIQIDIDEKSILELATLKPKDADVCPYSGEAFWETQK